MTDHGVQIGATEASVAGICIAYAAMQLALSLRFLTSTSQSLAFMNTAKPLLAALVVLGTGLLILAVLRTPRPLGRLLDSSILPVLLLAGLAYAEWHLYPLLDRDALKFIGEGSDADNALIDAAQRILHGESPYASPTYRGNPISPGIGWIVLNLPWASKATFFLLTPIYLGLLGLLLRAATRTWSATNIVLIGHIGCLGLLEIAPASDLVAFGAALCTTFIAAYMVRNSIWLLVCVALLMGTISSGRVPFALFPVLSAALLWRVTAGRSLILGLVGVGTAAAWHLGMICFDSSPYQPLHLFGAGDALLPGAWRYGAGLATVAVGALMLLGPKTTLVDAVFRCGICLAVPLAFVALAQLAHIGFETGRWEGANYLAPAFSFFVASLSMLALRRGDATTLRHRHPGCEGAASTDHRLGHNE